MRDDDAMDGHRVLLIDRYPEVRGALAARLALLPAVLRVEEAGDEVEALALAERQQPDLIVLEPKQLDAAGMTRRLRALVPRARILAYTSYFDREEHDALLDAGASAYLLKSLDLHELTPWLNGASPAAAAGGGVDST
jgi:DNA-binding NarL/FixJ family response regulator